MPAQIMLIDSHADDLRAISRILSHGGFTVVEAISGMKALGQIEAMSGEIDMVILDMVLEEPNGYEVCRSLRRNPDTMHLPILALMASRHKDHNVGVIDAGADDCMSKPCKPSELLVRVGAQLRCSRWQRSIAKQQHRNEKLRRPFIARQRGRDHFSGESLRQPGALVE